MDTSTTTRVLFVDDEADMRDVVAASLARAGQYDLRLAASAAEGKRCLQEQGPFAAVIADLEMPGENGIEFLARARELDPDATRIMLTGYATEQAAIEAVNRGELFQFLTKPIRMARLSEVLAAAVRKHDVRRAERQLLEDTLTGGVAALVEVLSMASPGVFGRSRALRDDAVMLCEALGVLDTWEIETAAMLCEAGLLSLGPRLLEKVVADIELSPAEQQLVQAHAAVGARLLGGIPRLEPVRQIVALQYKNYDGSGPPQDVALQGEALPLGARILRLLKALRGRLARGQERADAFREMSRERGVFDPALLSAARSAGVGAAAEGAPHIVTLSSAPGGSRLAEELRSSTGALIARRGQVLTAFVRERLARFVESGELPQEFAIEPPESNGAE